MTGLIMMVSALAGCGNDPGPDEEAVAATTAVTTTSTTTTTTTIPPEPKPKCQGEHRQAAWQVIGGWECEPIPEHLIDLDCIGDMIKEFSSDTGRYRCERPPAPECDDNSTSEWSAETGVWKCRRLTQDERAAQRNEKAAQDCIGSPFAWNGEFLGNYSPSQGYRCLILICDIPKQDHPSDRLWSNYACSEHHLGLTSSEVAVMEFQLGNETIKDLEKKFRSCRADSWTYADRITEYDIVIFWCHIKQ